MQTILIILFYFKVNFEYYCTGLLNISKFNENISNSSYQRNKQGVLRAKV